MTEEELEKKAEEYATEQEKNCILGVYDNTEDLQYDEGYNRGYVIGLEKGYIAGAKEIQKENEEFKKLFIFQKGKCVGKSKISVRPTVHYYGKDWNGYEYYKYSCPICDNSDCNHQVAKGELNCPICGINLEWEVT